MRKSLFIIGAAFVSCVSASSVQAQPRGRIVLFDDINFGGEQRVVDGEVRDFRSIGFNDRVSSIQITGSWEFCEDADFRGGCITLSRDDRNLVNDGFNDRISSARPVADRGNGNSGFDPRGGGNDQRGGGFDPRGGGYDQRGGGGGGGVTVYEDIGFGGYSRQLSDTVTDFQGLHFNDAVSSIHISSGSWEFCSDANFQGRCMTFDRDVPTLVPMGFNDVISSMRRVR